MVDEIDLKIMLALSKDGRCSYTRLSRELGIEEITVAKRIGILLKDDVFGIRAVPNPIKMGYKVMTCIALDVDRSIMDEVCNQLIVIPNISSVLVMFGKYDVLLFSEYRDVDTMYQQIRETISNIKGVKSIEPFMILEDKERYQEPSHIDLSSDKHLHIDKIDETLINELRKDGRAKFAALASKLRVSPATVARRVRALIKNEVIQITILANPIKLGNYVVAFLGLRVELKKINIISSRLYSFPQISSIITLLNGYNILAVVSLPNMQILSKFVNDEIASIDGVLDIDTLIRAEFKKGTYIRFDIEEMLRRSRVDNSQFPVSEIH